MKKNLFLLAIVMMVSVVAKAQRLDITFDDNSVISYNINKIKSLEFMPEAEPGQVDGYWYLGWRVTSSSQKNMNGDERWIFSGTVLKQIKSTGEEEFFDLTYAENKKTFKATSRNDGTTLTYTVSALEDELLVLKMGSTTRYFFRSTTDAYLAKEPYRYPNRTELTDTAKVWALKKSPTHSSISPMGEKYARYSAATAAQKEWLADASNQPDSKLIGLEDYKQWKAKTITLYPLNGGTPTPADVNQHAIGDCCMCAVFASFAYIYPDFIKSIITKVSSTKYTVKMYDPQGNPIEVAVDNKLLCNDDGYCPQLSGKNDKYNWATIMEKALMKWMTCFKTGGIEGIPTEHAAPPFTGNGDSWAYDWGQLFNSEMKIAVDYALKNGMICVGGFHQNGVLCGTLQTVTAHAFTVMYTRYPEKYAFSMRNPWGITSVDGVLEIPEQRSRMYLVDFRCVMPGAAAPYMRQDLGGYIPPKFVMGQNDRFLSPILLKKYNLDSYGPTPEEEDNEE